MHPASAALLSAEDRGGSAGLSQRKPSFKAWYSRQPDRYGIGAVEKQSPPEHKLVHTRTNSRVNCASILQIVLRAIALIPAVALVVFAVLIYHIAGLVSVTLRTAPFVSIFVCSLMLYVHARRNTITFRASANSMLTACALDLIVAALMAHNAYICWKEWLSTDNDWQTMVGDHQVKDILILVTAILNCVCGLLHTFTLPAGIYLWVVYMKLSRLPPDPNPLEREALTARSKKRDSGDWPVQHAHKLSDVTLIGEPQSPLKLDISWPSSPTRDDSLFLPPDPTREPQQLAQQRSVRYSPPMVVPYTPANEVDEGGYHKPQWQRFAEQSAHGHERARSRLDTAHLDATATYAGEDDGQPKTLGNGRQDLGRNLTVEIPHGQFDGDWYYQRDVPEFNDKSVTVLHHKPESKKKTTRSLYGPDHVYSYCGLNEDIEEEDEDGAEDHDAAHSSNPRTSRTAHSGTQNGYTQVAADAEDDDSDPNEDTVIIHESARERFYASPTRRRLAGQLLKAAEADSVVQLPSPDEVDDTYNPLTGSVKGITPFPLLAPPNQSGGIAANSRDRYYSSPAAQSSQPSTLETIIQSPTEPTRPAARNDKPSDDAAQKKKSQWVLHKSKWQKAHADASNTHDHDDEGHSSSSLGPAPAATMRGDREGRVVSNSGAERFAGEYKSASTSSKASSAAAHSIRMVTPAVAGAKQRKVSGKVPVDEEFSIVSTASLVSSASGGREARQGLGVGQGRTGGRAGWR